MNLNELSLLIPTVFLIIACGFDVKTRRFPNWVFVSSAVIGFVFLLVTKNNSMFFATMSLLSAVVVFMTLTPLFFLGMLGAGDLKLMSVLCLLTNPTITLTILVYSLFWGLLIGLLKLTLSGELITFAQSFILRNPQTSQQKIPYTVAILLGWLSYLSAGGIL